MTIQYDISRPSDLDAIKHLLKIHKLPYDDIGSSPGLFLIAREAETIVGCIGIEKYGKNGLLRSFAVIPALQNKGIGKSLYKRLKEYAVQNGITNLHLLTETASGYFSRLGYQQMDRNEAPSDIKNTREFKDICPVSSVFMRLSNILHNAL